MTEQRYNAIFKELKTAHYEKEQCRRDRTRPILDTLTYDEGAILFNKICSLYGKGILFKPESSPAQISTTAPLSCVRMFSILTRAIQPAVEYSTRGRHAASPFENPSRKPQKCSAQTSVGCGR